MRILVSGAVYFLAVFAGGPWPSTATRADLADV
jgi:hypothetical protein